jgi:hypothetical protein
MGEELVDERKGVVEKADGRKRGRLRRAAAAAGC